MNQSRIELLRLAGGYLVFYADSRIQTAAIAEVHIVIKGSALGRDERE